MRAMAPPTVPSADGPIIMIMWSHINKFGYEPGTVSNRDSRQFDILIYRKVTLLRSSVKSH